MLGNYLIHLQVSIYINFPTKDLEGRELEMLEKQVPDIFIRKIIKIIGRFLDRTRSNWRKEVSPYFQRFSS